MQIRQIGEQMHVMNDAPTFALIPLHRGLIIRVGLRGAVRTCTVLFDSLDLEASAAYLFKADFWVSACLHI
jgi:hypothetical protein